MELKNWLKGKIIVYAQVGDMDACSSFVAFSELVDRLTGKNLPEMEFAVGTMNKDGKKILDMFNFKVKHFEIIVEQDFGKLVLIDTQPNQMPKQFAKCDMLVIDHHQKTSELGLFNFWNTDVASTTEIIYDLFLKNSVEPSKDAAKAILYGIVSDTAGLRFVKTASLGTIYHLLNDHKLDYQSILGEIFEEKDYSEKTACLKAAQRMKIKPFGDKKILVISEIGGFESSVASKMITLGADISLIISKKENETRIVGRAKKDWNLAEVFHKVAIDIKDASAGGHPGAAVINMPADREAVALSKILKILKIE
ncbi:MAG: DHH family phosphoesterase [archaeon]